jgi:hypothetical protein
MRNIVKSLLAVFVFACLLLWPREAVCGKVNIAAGTKVAIHLKAPVSTENEAPSNLASIFEIASSDSMAGIEVFKKGGRVIGRVVEFKKPGRLGKPGEVQVRVDSLETVWGKLIAVRPVTLSVVGKAKKLKAYLTLPLLGYGYFFVKGGHAVLGAADQEYQVLTAKFEEITF